MRELQMNRRALLLGGFAAAGGCANAPPAPPAVASGAPGLAIDEGLFVDINGLPQWITIRGRDLSNPVQLLLHGGPGAAASHMAPLFAESERYVTRVTWDQPGGGQTALRTKEQGELTAARFIRDGHAVADYVRKRLGKRKLILSGASFGTRLGAEMIQQRPDTFSAYVGNGQVVGVRGASMRYDLALRAARERRDAPAIAALERVGPPPFRSVADYFVCQQYANPPGLPAGAIEQAATDRMNKALAGPPPPGAKYIAYPGKPALDPAVFLATQTAMFDESQRWDIRNLGRDFKVPVFVFQGEHDCNAPPAAAKGWLDEIRAPRKAFEIVPGAGHNPAPFAYEYLQLLRLHVLPIVQS